MPNHFSFIAMDAVWHPHRLHTATATKTAVAQLFILYHPPSRPCSSPPTANSATFARQKSTLENKEIVHLVHLAAGECRGTSAKTVFFAEWGRFGEE
jgi:hypothetical protein